MKKIVIIIIAALSLTAIVAISSGCGTQAAASQNMSSDQYAKIDVGMGQDQVKAIAGEPAKTESKTMSGSHQMGGMTMSGGSMTVDYWYYQGSKGWVRIELAYGKVTAKSGY